MSFEDWLYLTQCKATLIRLENRSFNLIGLTLVTTLIFIMLINISRYRLDCISGFVFILIQLFRFWTSKRIKFLRNELTKLEEV